MYEISAAAAASVVIEGVTLTPKEYNGQRVVTFKDIDAVHHRPEGTAKRNFRANKDHFVEGKDYFGRNSSEALSEYGITAPNGLTLITERGYLKLVKSFTDPLAWQVQDELVDGYFYAKKAAQTPGVDLSILSPEVRAIVELSVKQHEQEQKLARIEAAQKEQAQAVKEVVGVFALPTIQREQWCEQMNRRISAICQRDNIPHQKFRGDTYRELEETAGVDLANRLTRKKKRLKEAGEKSSVIKDVSKLQIISEDPKLRGLYESIIRRHDAQNLACRYFN